MKTLLFALVICLGMTGCVEGGYYDDPPAYGPYASGEVEFCDDLGCRMVDAPYYYSNGEVIYWDAHFGCWIGPQGYWRGGAWYRGQVFGYHGWYGAGHYHSFHSGWGHSGGGHWGGHAGHGGGGRGGHR